MKSLEFTPNPVVKINVSVAELASIKSPELRIKVEELIKQNEYLLQLQRQSEVHASRDAATGAHNRHAFYEQAHVHFKLMKRYKTTLRNGHNPQMPQVSIVTMRLDSLKQISDFSGHKAAEEALKATVDFFTRHLRPNDFFARVSRDEFCILMPIEEETTRTAMSRLKAEFEKQFTRRGQTQHYLSFSYGVRQLLPNHASVAQLVQESENDQRHNH